MAVTPTFKSRVTRYFYEDGRANLTDVLKFVHQSMKRRAELRDLKVVFLTAFGEGPVLAVRMLRELHPKMIAVTFPPTTLVSTSDGRQVAAPKMSDEVAKFLRAMDVTLIQGRLPFDLVAGVDGHNSSVTLIQKLYEGFGRSFPLCIQAVLQACDAGAISEGEDVIAITGDCAALICAAPTSRFLQQGSCFMVREFICKPASRGVGFPATTKSAQKPATLKQIEAKTEQEHVSHAPSTE